MHDLKGIPSDRHN